MNDFNTYPVYEGDDLGAHLKTDATTFRVWSPVAEILLLRVYSTAGKLLIEQQMTKRLDGTWYYKLYGNWENHAYTFQAHIDDQWFPETVDPYAKAVTVNGLKGVITDLFLLPPHVPVNNTTSDTIIYEVHIRDVSIDAESGISLKGKFLGLAEPETSTSAGTSTGLSHLVELGITHVHLLPCADFKTVDETNPIDYNWGYDPQNYNVPEGSYATDPHTPAVRNVELKVLINALHAHGIKVVMDVVYNHTYLTEGSSFNNLVPRYYYRQWDDGSYSNGSGCGNELATERGMVRKFIIDSLIHWVQTYDVDGFRFDLMALYDLTTMYRIRENLGRIKPGLLLYGEGWTGDASPLAESHRASKENTVYLEGFKSFNDDFRDALKGKLFDARQRGFISGEGWMEETIKFGIVGGIYHPQIDYNLVLYSKRAWALSPTQSVNYISCHDNHTLFDKLKASNENASSEDLENMQSLGLSMILTAQGVPFLHAGSEFLRTKHGHHNSYNAPDEINMIDWQRKEQYMAINDFVRDLILLRKEQSIFRLGDADAVRSALKFHSFVTGNLVGYDINHPSPHKEEWSSIKVFHNGTNAEKTALLSSKDWKIALSGRTVFRNPQRINETEINIPAYATVILCY